MHISDGILSPLWILVWWVLALAFVGVGLHSVRKSTRAAPGYMPMIALLGAAVLVISIWHIPVPVAGSCSHPVGTPMAAIIVGPFAAVLISFVVLFFQLFIGHGGLTSLGANTISMGVIGAFAGFYCYQFCTRLHFNIFSAGAIAGTFGSLLVYVMTALQLALALHPESLLKYWGIYALGFIPTQIPLAIIEGIITGIAIKYIADVRPEMLRGYTRVERKERVADG